MVSCFSRNYGWILDTIAKEQHPITKHFNTKETVVFDIVILVFWLFLVILVPVLQLFVGIFGYFGTGSAVVRKSVP